jgi:hypothetical protein
LLTFVARKPLPAGAVWKDLDEALVESGLKVSDDYIITERKGDVETRQCGAEAMGQLLSLTPRPDGVFCLQ